MQRPTSLSIVGWFCIAVAAFSLLGALLIQANPTFRGIVEQNLTVPFWIYLTMALVGTSIRAVCGYGILKGLNWSRFLYAGWTLVALIYASATAPFGFMVLGSWAVQGLIIYLLFRPAANDWFGQASKEAELERVFGD